MPTYAQELEVAREAARMAGRLCLAVRREMLGDDPSQARLEKAGKEPVTIADYGAQAIVLRHIARFFSADASIAEERASEFEQLTTPEQQAQIVHHLRPFVEEEPSLDRIKVWLDIGRDSKGSRIWTVDPIDGTKGFLRGDQFAVAVALLADGVPVVGALGCPLLPSDGGEIGVVASAALGKGAMVEGLESMTKRPLRVSKIADPAEARTVESFEAGHTDHSFSVQVFQSSGIGGKPVRMDSQAKYVTVADGRAEIYLRNSPGDYREKVWDHAAGVLIVQEAGGRVSDLNGQALDFTRGARLEANRGILASNGPLHAAVLKGIQQADAQSQNG